MRLVCDKCAAAYAIDDRLVSPRGVRAQCPRCRHLQLVTPQSAKAAAATAAPPGHRPAPPASPISLDEPLVKEATSGCRECNEPLLDPFDQALGVCDACRAKAHPEPAFDPISTTEDEPLLPDLKPPTTPAEATAGSPRSAPVPVRPAPLPARGVVLSATRPGAPSPDGAGRWVAVSFGLVLILGGAAAAFAFRERLSGPPRERVDPNVPPEAIASVIPAFRMAHQEVTGTAADHLREGHERLREDRAASYEKAAASFQKALILDPESDVAVAGYVKAIALARAGQLDDGTFAEAEKLIEAAQRRAGRAPETVLAEAWLRLTRPKAAGNLERARALAEEILSQSEDPSVRAEANLVMGRSWQASSGALAVERLTEALTLDPGLRAALYHRALAHELAGNYPAALEDLTRRLEMDPGHWASRQALARLYREAGRLTEAREVYRAILKADPGHTRARLAAAVFRYQAEGRTGEALVELRAMAKALAQLEGPDQAEVLLHLATAERIAGNENAAVEAANRALEKDPASVAPRLQLFLVALRRGLATDAQTHFDALRAGIDDEGLEKLLEGRLRMVQRRWTDAARSFREAAAADRRRVDALLLAGIASARAGQATEAFKALFEAARSDPGRTAPPAPPHLYFDEPGFLRGHEGTFLRLAASNQDVLPLLHEGVLRYHLGDFASARRLTRQATDLDTNNALAHAWNAFAALGQGDVRGAEASGARAVAAGRQVAIAHYAHGAALAAAKKDEPARRALREAVALDPGLIGAEEILAELDARQGDLESARRRLSQIVTLDPSYWSAKQLLFSLHHKEATREGPGPR